MKIEVLYFEDCPNHKPAVERIKEVLREEGLAGDVVEVEVPNAETARRLRFLGSPSICVNGLDIEPAARSAGEFGLMCRRYEEGGLPSRELIRTALRGMQPPASESGGPPMRRSFIFGGSLVAAVAASLCCILPILATVTGIAALGAAATFSRFRPYLLGVTAVLFVLGIVRAYHGSRRACTPGSVCATSPVQRWNVLLLVFLGALVAGIAAFPYYSGRVAEAVSTSVSPQQAAGQVTTTSFLIADMDCPACAVGFRTAFEKLPGVTHAAVDYGTRRVTITYDPAQQRPETFAKVVSDAGFHVKPSD